MNPAMTNRFPRVEPSFKMDLKKIKKCQKIISISCFKISERLRT